MGFPTPDVPMNDLIAPAMHTPPTMWRCATCRNFGQLTYRQSGWVVICPCPNCPAPAAPESEGNPTSLAAIRHWNWKQGGPR